MNNYSTPIRYGLIGGFAMSIVSVIQYMFYNQLFGSLTVQMLFGLLTFGLMIFIPVWGVVTFKRQLGKVTFQEAFAAGLIIVAITLAFSTVTAYLIPNVIDKEYPEQLYEKVRTTTAESMEKFGVPDEEVEKAMERIKLEDFNPTLLSTLKSFGIGLAIGAVLCLIIAAFVSRPEKSEPTLTSQS